MFNPINEQLASECSTYPDLITEDEVLKAISRLNPKKAADELGLVAEHLKFSGRSVVSEITGIFNAILSDRRVPQLFKTGILTPVLKKSKDASLMGNYRGITVTPVTGKLFEITILPCL